MSVRNSTQENFSKVNSSVTPSGNTLEVKIGDTVVDRIACKVLKDKSFNLGILDAYRDFAVRRGWAKIETVRDATGQKNVSVVISNLKIFGGSKSNLEKFTNDQKILGLIDQLFAAGGPLEGKKPSDPSPLKNLYDAVLNAEDKLNRKIPKVPGFPKFFGRYSEVIPFEVDGTQRSIVLSKKERNGDLHLYFTESPPDEVQTRAREIEKLSNNAIADRKENQLLEELLGSSFEVPKNQEVVDQPETENVFYPTGRKTSNVVISNEDLNSSGDTKKTGEIQFDSATNSYVSTYLEGSADIESKKISRKQYKLKAFTRGSETNEQKDVVPIKNLESIPDGIPEIIQSEDKSVAYVLLKKNDVVKVVRIPEEYLTRKEISGLRLVPLSDGNGAKYEVSRDAEGNLDVKIL